MISGIDKDFARERLSKHFVYESYDEENGLFFNRASVGFVLLGWPLVGTSLGVLRDRIGDDIMIKK